MKNESKDIVINGVRITPELIAAIKELKSHDNSVNIRKVKDSMYLSLAGLTVAAGEEYVYFEDIQNLATTGYYVYQFLSALETIDCIEED
jgi:hypothetical protein